MSAFRTATFRAGAICAMALLAAACAETARFDAAGDVRAFLVSIRDGDRAAFDAHVDRPALKAQLRARLMAEAARRGGGGAMAALSAALIRPLLDAAEDQLIQPDVFRAVADYLGYSAQTPIPGRLVIAQALRPLDEDRVCVARSRDAPCVLVFRNEDGVWRLIGFEGDAALLRAPKGF
jgi:hypothetical protein